MATLDLGKVRFSFKGYWSASTAYEYYDMVHYNHNSYVCNTLAGVAAGGNNPVTDAGTNWLVMAEGVPGATGPQGPQGTTNPATTSSAGLVKPDGSTITVTPDGTISSPAQTTITGNAGSATKLKTAITISLTGAVTGSSSFDGSANTSINTTIANPYTDAKAAKASLPGANRIALSSTNGVQLTAALDGWVTINFTIDAANFTIQLQNNTTGYYQLFESWAPNTGGSLMIQVRKGDIFKWIGNGASITVGNYYLYPLVGAA